MSKNESLRPPSQSGFMLLEVLVAILIFAIGVLSIVGLQVNSIKQSTAGKYRTDASFLADDIIGRMWVSDRSFNTINTRFTTGGTEFNAWLANVQAVLPGSTTYPPRVTVVSSPSGLAGGPASSIVTVTLRWKAPSEPAADPAHSLAVYTQIK